MHCPQPSRQISIVVRWPQGVAENVAHRLAEKLINHRLPATWSVENAAQASTLYAGRDAVAVDIAVLVSQSAPSSDAADALATTLRAFEEKAIPAAVAHMPGGAERGAIERRLRQLGITALVADAVAIAPVRALPFGIWQFCPQLRFPAPRGWRRFLRRGPSRFSDSTVASPVMASIDLGKLAVSGPHAWRAIDRLLAEAAELLRLGSVQVLTIAELAAQFSRTTSAKPQRSILREAA